MKMRLGFLSPIGLVVAVVALAGLIGWTLIKGPVLFSPGPLNSVAKAQTLGGVTTHAQLAANCGACHPAPWSGQKMADRCLACHQSVSTQIRGATGLHGTLLANAAAATCRVCHTEHKGATASLNVLDAATFPHDKTGYSLRAHAKADAGAKVGCTDCHPQDLTNFDQAACAGCHGKMNASFMPQHVTTFGSQCVPCHDGIDRYTADFDHNKLAFKLAGKHAALPCGQCHTQATTVQALQQTPQYCYSCHAKDDNHQGSFGRECGQCHTSDNWTNASFDHSKANFPLDGAHAKVTCAQCHKNGVFKGTTTDCVGCHAQPDFHANAFGTQSTQCASCHTTAAWDPAQFSLGHATFPLNHGEREQAAGCKTCHPASVKAYTCFGCHEHTEARVQADHEGRTAAELVDCISCHEGGRGGD